MGLKRGNIDSSSLTLLSETCANCSYFDHRLIMYLVVRDVHAAEQVQLGDVTLDWLWLLQDVRKLADGWLHQRR
jgi:hypothetical protein